MEKGIQNVYVLGEDEGLILKANEAFVDSETVGTERGEKRGREGGDDR